MAGGITHAHAKEPSVKDFMRLYVPAAAPVLCNPRPAPRPKNSRLDKMGLRLANLPQMPQWREALAEFMAREFNA